MWKGMWPYVRQYLNICMMPDTVEAQVQTQAIPCMVWSATVTRRVSSKCFTFPMSVSFHQCSILIHIHQSSMLKHIKHTTNICVKKPKKIMKNFSQDRLTRGQCLIQSLQNAQQRTALLRQTAVQCSTHWPGFTSLYVATPYASISTWKPYVNLLVLLYVGGSSNDSILFKIGGTELPLRSCTS